MPELTHEQLIAILEYLAPFAAWYADQALYADQHEAEDVAQEAMTVLIQLLRQGKRPKIHPQGEPHSEYKPWLKEIVRRTAHDHYRQLKKWQASQMPDPEMLSSPDSTLKLDVADEEANLRRCLCELPERIRDVLAASYFEKETPNEIAARLSMPANTVRLWIRRGLLQLAAVLNRETIQ